MEATSWSDFMMGSDDRNCGAKGRIERRRCAALMAQRDAKTGCKEEEFKRGRRTVGRTQ
jgi:hypothetical protein